MDDHFRRGFSLLGRYERRLFALPNVLGYGLGHKERAGVRTAEPALTVLVRRKIALTALGEGESVPPYLGGLVTDVVEVGDLVALVDEAAERSLRYRPAPPGVSVGHKDVSAGTFGALVVDGATGQPLILSNNHVLANTTDGRDGRARVGDVVLQPGSYDGGTADDVIATLERFSPVRRMGGTNDGQPRGCLLGLLGAAARRRTGRLDREPRNLVDAAVARPLRDDDISAEILGIGIPRGTADVAVGARVQKSGRTSGLTTGEVRVLQATVQVGMGDAGQALFVDQIVTTPMAQPGDSGSLLVDGQARAVGLLFAGSNSATVHNRIENVKGLLEVGFPT